MFYYYVVKLTDNYNTIDSKILEKYMNKKRFKSLEDENLSRLAEKTGKSFLEVIRNVFRAYVEVEHKVEEMVAMDENIYPDDKFASLYFDAIKDHIKPSDKNKIHDLKRVHNEDIRFMKQRKDNFFTHLSNDPEVNNDQVIILLNHQKIYFGHIYIWSWLSSSRGYNNLYTLKFGGIRTSLQNLITGIVKGISSLFINIIGEWGINHGYKYMEIGLNPIGTMPDNLKACGSSDDYIIKIKNIKCKENRDFLQLKPSTDIFTDDDFSFDEWYSRMAAEDSQLIKNTWFESDDIHKLFKMTYPDKRPSAEGLEKIYILIYNGMKDYHIGGPKTINVEDKLTKISKTLKEKREDLMREEREGLINEEKERALRKEKKYSMRKEREEKNSSEEEIKPPKVKSAREEKEDKIMKIMISLFRIKEQFDYTVTYYNNLNQREKSDIDYEFLINIIKRIRDDFYHLASSDIRYGGVTSLSSNIKHRLMIF